MCHKFLVLTVKKLLKSVYIYGSYRKIKTGLSLFWTTLYIVLRTPDEPSEFRTRWDALTLVIDLHSSISHDWFRSTLHIKSSTFHQRPAKRRLRKTFHRLTADRVRTSCFRSHLLRIGGWIAADVRSLEHCGRRHCCSVHVGRVALVVSLIQ